MSVTRWKFPLKSVSKKARVYHPRINPRLIFSRRPSYDLFECVTQAPHQRFTESQARDVFSQISDAVQYLSDLGIAHRDIKDENIVIDKNFKQLPLSSRLYLYLALIHHLEQIKLIDFGSATITNPNDPRPLSTEFFGTPHYAASEILRRKPYQAAPAEIRTSGVLLSYLLTGASPFANVWDAADGRIFLVEERCVLPVKGGRGFDEEVFGSGSWDQGDCGGS